MSIRLTNLRNYANVSKEVLHFRVLTFKTLSPYSYFGLQTICQVALEGL